MVGGGGFQGIVGVPGMEQGIITDSPLANMKQVKDPIWLREGEHVGTMTENNISFFIHQPVLTLKAPVYATHTCDKRWQNFKIKHHTTTTTTITLVS